MACFTLPSCFIQYKNRWVFQQRSGNCDPGDEISLQDCIIVEKLEIAQNNEYFSQNKQNF